MAGSQLCQYQQDPERGGNKGSTYPELIVVLAMLINSCSTLGRADDLKKPNIFIEDTDSKSVEGDLASK